MATNKTTNTTKAGRRAKPLVPKAGYTTNRRRYPNGGKVTK